MTRQIKFRAWHKILKEMRDDPYVGCSGFEYFDINGITSDEDQILMQFTGLLDKDGKEIYEGDIVELVVYATPPMPQETKTRLTVRWNEAYSITGFTITKDMASIVQVIGNIYENPELIEGGTTKG